MRDFDIVIDLREADDIKNREINEFILEAFHGIGKIRLGINIINLENVSEQYKEFLTKSGAMDCYIFTPSIAKNSYSSKEFEFMFKKIKSSNANIKFINMYNGSDNLDKELTIKIIEKFIADKVGECLYNMDISKDSYVNVSYLNRLKDKVIALKTGTEIKISDIYGFLSKYDSMICQKDEYTAEHSRAVCKFAIEMGKKVKLSKDQLMVLAIGAALHDIGKYEIDIGILTKNKRLSDPEFLQIKNHPMIGKSILDNIIMTELSERDNEVIEFIVEQHHERFDGTGYPRKLDGSMIHEYSMIVSLIDAFHAMLGRSYQSPKKKTEIIKIIKECSSTQFNPKYVNIICGMIENTPQILGLEEKEGYLRYNSKQSIKELIIQIN